MAFSDPVFFHDFLPKAVGGGIHALDTATIKAAVVTAVPLLQTAAVLADLTQPSGNGYTAGGVTCAVTPPTHVGGIYRLMVTGIPNFTATGAGYSGLGIAFYNNTATSKNLIAAVFQSAAGALAITNVAQSGTTATITAAGHGFANGNTVVHDGLPFARLNGTLTVAGVTTNTYQVTSPISETIASQAVTTGKVIRPESFSVTPSAPFPISPNTASGLLAVAPFGVSL